MKTIYFTVTGTWHYHGQEFMAPGMKVDLIKDTDNEFDKEAIRVELEGLGKIGFVANSPQIVLGESYSAGRLYDKIGDRAVGEVMYLLPEGVLCRLKETKERPEEEPGTAVSTTEGPASGIG